MGLLETTYRRSAVLIALVVFLAFPARLHGQDPELLISLDFKDSSVQFGSPPVEVPINVTASDGSAIPYALNLTFSGYAGAISVTSTFPQVTPGVVTVTFNSTGIAPNTTPSQVVIAFSSTGASNSPVNGTYSFSVFGDRELAVNPIQVECDAFQGDVVQEPFSLSSTGFHLGELLFEASAVEESGSGWLDVSPGSGITPSVITVSCNAASLTPGLYAGYIELTDTAARSVVVPVSLNVTPAPPVIAEISNHATPEGSPYTGPTPSLLQGTLPITWSLIANPSGMTINSTTGVVSWSSPTTVGSPHTVTIRATNSAGFDDETWLLTVTPPVIAPIISAISDHATQEGSLYTGPTPALTQGTLPVTWSLIANPSGMTISSTTGVVSWSSPTTVGSPHTVTIRATNSAGFDDETWQLTVTPPVIAPIISAISDHSTQEGSPYTGPTPALTQGTLPVTWSLIAKPTGMTINSTTGVVSWASPTTVGSPHTVTIRATNSAGFDDETWLLTVTPPVIAPIISAISDHATQEGSLYTGPTPALTQGTLPVTWSLIANPSGMTISSTTGVVSWSSPTTVGSPHTVTIRATNSAGSDDESWLLTVTPVPPIISPISDHATQEGSPYTGPTPALTQGTLPITWSLMPIPVA